MHRLLAGLLLLSGCSVAKGGDAPITDAQVESYIKAYRNLKGLGPGIAERYKQGETPPDGQADFAKIESAIKSAGFSGYPDFVRTNARIAWAFNTAEGQAFMNDMAKNVDDGEKQMQAAIDNPDTPEAAKVELRAGKAKLHAEYMKNKGWANVSMKVANKLTSPENVAVMERHRKELEKVFQER